MKQITKQIKRLADLQTIDLSLVFCIRDNVQQRQLIKFCGKGEFLQRLKAGKPVLNEAELRRLSKSTTETYLPKMCSDETISMVTPSKLACGPGVSKHIASQQKEMLVNATLSCLTDEHEESFSIDVDSPKTNNSGKTVQQKPTQNRSGKAKSSKDERKRKTKRKLIEDSGILARNEQSDEDLNEVDIEQNNEADQTYLCESERVDQNIEKQGAPAEKKKKRNGKGKTKETASSPMTSDNAVSEDDNTNEPSDEPINEAIEDDDSDKIWKINGYYAIAFEDRWYPGCVVNIKEENKDWATIKYMHPCGEYFKKTAEKALAHINAVLCEINVITLANGRLHEVEQKSHIDDLYKSQSHLEIVEIDVN